MKRRRLLATAGVGAASLLAGCSDDGEEGTETPEGEWELRGRVVNGDDEPREWRVETSSESGSVASASGTIPVGEEWDFALLGQLRDEQREVLAGSDSGATTVTWQPTDCRRLFVEVTISGGRPGIQADCAE